MYVFLSKSLNLSKKYDLMIICMESGIVQCIFKKWEVDNILVLWYKYKANVQNLMK